jgi:hypothetical protein
MATKTKTKKKALRVTTLTPTELRERARTLLRRNGETITKFRKAMKAEPAIYPSCKAGANCELCDAARLLKRADRLAKAA